MIIKQSGTNVRVDRPVQPNISSGTHPSTSIYYMIKPASEVSGEMKHYEISGAE